MIHYEDDQPSGVIRTVLGDRRSIPDGVFYAHEHLIIDSPLVEAAFPHIYLSDVAAAVHEASLCRETGVRIVVDAMPCSSGRDATKLAQISEQSGVDIISVTGLHHDRYYGQRHWTNRVSTAELARLFVADLTEGIDLFDYTGPIVKRTEHRAGALKIATSGGGLDERDKRNLAAVASASRATGAPVLTHCEAGLGALEQVAFLTDAGLAASSIVLSHVDKSMDLDYLRRILASGAILEFDQALRQFELGADGWSLTAMVSLIQDGFWRQLVVGTDGARRSLWSALGGSPGLAWLAANLPTLLADRGISQEQVRAVTHDNAVRAFSWSAPAGPLP